MEGLRLKRNFVSNLTLKVEINKIKSRQDK